MTSVSWLSRSTTWLADVISRYHDGKIQMYVHAYLLCLPVWRTHVRTGGHRCLTLCCCCCRRSAPPRPVPNPQELASLNVRNARIIVAEALRKCPEDAGLYVLAGSIELEGGNLGKAGPLGPLGGGAGGAGA